MVDWASAIRNSGGGGSSGGTVDWAGAIKQPASPKPDVSFTPVSAADDTGFFGKLAVGAGRGLTDVGQGLKQAGLAAGEALGLADEGAAADYTASVQGDRDLYARDMGERGGAAAGFGRFVGQTAPFLAVPMGAAGGIGRLAAQGAGAGGLAGAAQFVEEGGSRALNTVVGAGAGGLGGAAVGGLARGVGAVRDRIAGAARPQPLMQGGQLTAQGQQALADAGVDIGRLSPAMVRDVDDLVRKGLTPQQAIRAAEARAQGIDLTRGQVARDFQAQSDEFGAAMDARQGTQLREFLARQNQQIGQRLDDMVAGTGAQRVDEFGVGQSVREGLGQGAERVRQANQQLYTQARQQMGTAPLPATRLQRQVDELADYGESLVPQVRVIGKRLERLSGDKGGITPEQAEILRREVSGMLGEAQSPTQRSFVGRLLDALDDDVSAGPGGDVFRNARAVARQGFAKYRDVKPVDAILSGKVADERIVKGAAQSWSVKDTRSFMDTLRDASPDAVNDFRGGVMDWIRRQATTGGRDQYDNPEISAAGLKRALERLGPEKLRAVFDDEQVDALMQLSRVVDTIKNPLRGTVNSSYTATTALNRIRQVFNAVPGISQILRLVSPVGQVLGLAADRAATVNTTRAALNPVGSLARSNRQEALRGLAAARNARPVSAAGISGPGATGFAASNLATNER